VVKGFKVSQVLRILDANANRAREALRVMEEAARFILDDASLTQQLKQLRHDLTSALSAVPGLEAHRDTPGDVGTAIATEREGSRASMVEVAIAAGKRLSEALRAIEEYGKVLAEAAPTLATAMEQLRYRGYDIEQRLQQALGSGKAQQWRLCVLISEHLCTHHHWLDVARAAYQAGADCVQLREKELSDRALLQRAQAAADLPNRATLIINDRPHIALLSGADGVHLGQDDLPVHNVRQLVGRQLIIGVSTSRLDEAKAALRDGADYCGVGPMFATTTKHKEHIVGPTYLREYLAWNRLPHLAIGGITPDNVHELVAAGVHGIAVSACVCNAKDPGQVVQQLCEAMHR